MGAFIASAAKAQCPDSDREDYNHLLDGSDVGDIKFYFKKEHPTFWMGGKLKVLEYYSKRVYLHVAVDVQLYEGDTIGYFIKGQPCEYYYVLGEDMKYSHKKTLRLEMSQTERELIRNNGLKYILLGNSMYRISEEKNKDILKRAALARI